jgi:mitochondrial fission protein ELM1
VVELLRALGHQVYDFRNPEGKTGFAWSSIDEDWEQWTTEEYYEALKHPIAEAGFKSDFDAMKWSDACIMVLPCGSSANTEAGWMKGAGKKVFVYSPVKQEPELMYKIYDDLFIGEHDIINEFS